MTVNSAKDWPQSGRPARCVALVGPQSVGKTTLMEAILAATGAVPRKGSVRDGSSLGDASDEARARQMSTELNVAQFNYLGDSWCVLDCPGSVELAQETVGPLMVADAAVVVCEPDMARFVALSPLLRQLDELGVPHLVFINKLDGSSVRMRDVLQALQAFSARPLLLRQVPIREGETITGYVDLVSERAYRYRPGEPSDLIQVPDSVREREQGARQELLEALADFDDRLLEQLLEDVQPATAEIYGQIAKDVAEDLIVPVLMGAAEHGFGVRRLLKALRHEVPDPARTAGRLGTPAGEPVLQVFKTVHAPHTGKMSYARVWRGTVTDAASFGSEKISGLYRVSGPSYTKIPSAGEGELVALGKLDGVATGDILTPSGSVRNELWPAPLPPVYSVAITARNRNDEVKLSAALARMTEEDPSLVFGHDADTGEMVLRGQGDVHLQIAVDRLARRGNVAVDVRPPQVPYKETIRRKTSQHARFKRQTGGHGQFADVHLDIKPLPRGAGFQFDDVVVGGAVPKNYIPAVEAGVRDYLGQGPLGFPVVDVAVTLTNGQYHSVDSSEQAFRTAGRMAMAEALPNCEPVLLEPICEVSLLVPSDCTAKAQRMLSQRRGQILGYDTRPGWTGWDEVRAYLPQAEMRDMIVELRSITLGVGTYTMRFDHLAELTGKMADKVIEARQTAIAAQ